MKTMQSASCGLSRMAMLLGAAITLGPLARANDAMFPPAPAARKAIDFDLKTGTYSLRMPHEATLAIRHARATVEGWASTDAGYQRRIAL
ncbi:MAG: hypothetical protein NTW21_35440 [Verrucomicrobia bacterium]|nr:hypothetical protein [Verrucomicrobiota bacterium]